MILRLADRASSPAIAMMLLTEFHIKNGTIQQKKTARQIQQRWVDKARTHYSQMRRKDNAEAKACRLELSNKILERKAITAKVQRYLLNQRRMQRTEQCN